MAQQGRDHEPPAAPATLAVVAGVVSFVQGLVVPGEGTLSHVLVGVAFGVVAVLAGWRTLAIAPRGRRARRWAVTGVVLGVLGLGMLVYQSLVLVTDGAVPPPFWAPYRR